MMREREDDGVSLFDFGVLVIVDGGARERGHGLALRAADEHANFFRRKILHLAGIDDQAVGDFDVAEILGDLGGIVHGAAEERDFAAVLVGELDREIDAVNRRRKAGNEKPPLGVGEYFVELSSYGALAGRVSLALDVGGILEQSQHAVLAVFGEGVQVEKFVVGGRGIDLEIAGVNDDAERRVDGERNAIDQAVRHLDGMNGERSGLEALVGTHLAQVGVVEQAVLVEFVFDVGQRELGAPDGDLEFREHPGKRADVVFVAVGQDDSAHALAVFDEIGDVGDHDVDAEKFGFGEHESGVDDDDVVSPADGHAVHTELAQAPEGDNLQFSSWHGVKMMLAQARSGELRSGATLTWKSGASAPRQRVRGRMGFSPESMVLGAIIEYGHSG